MKKLMFVLLGAASFVIYKSLFSQPEDSDVLPRPLPRTFDGKTSEEEVAGPAGEV